MRIAYVEIANFRKLLAVRIDLAQQTTLFVGANNSGKTSAMLALRHFLLPSGSSRFCLNDFTLLHWPKIDAIGNAWKAEGNDASSSGLQLDEWYDIVPTLDLWLNVEDGEIHHVSKLIPTLDWTGGLLGVRLRFQPKDATALRKDYRAALANVDALKAAASGQNGAQGFAAQLWPESMTAFLDKRLQTHFAIEAYTLDPSKAQEPKDGLARLQKVPADQEPVDSTNLRALIRIDEINAQRVFGDEADGEGRPKQDARSARQLSVQLRSYYAKHLDPSDNPDATDLEALEAIERAQKAFDERLEAGFASALGEVQGLGYPGVTDPRIKISTRLKPVEGLNHDTAIQYEVEAVSVDPSALKLRLPEHFNGLGYQHLVSMVFRLMSFRDAWMRVGKAGKGAALDTEVPPLHLVLVEEPEAHLHAQVQQVFIQKAYSILRNHADLRANKKLHTQLVVSTHSSHVAREADFSSLRYFRRLPAGLKASIAVSTVVNLSQVFGPENDTKRFVMRYLKAQHCDLFFADAAIFVEGPAERMLVPHFIGLHYPSLRQSYITLLEIGGSHAHRLKPLIDELKLLTLVITDLDAADTKGGASAQPARGTGQVTNNTTLETWVPKRDKIDDLCALDDEKKTCSDERGLFAVRAAYQIPVKVTFKSEKSSDVLPYTFEDALVFENLGFFGGLKGTGLVRKFQESIASCTNSQELGAAMFAALKNGKKAEFALDVIDAENFEGLQVPTYIAEGLDWLQQRLQKAPIAAPPIAKKRGATA
jgi:predicted ATP-dependent endonuclease of OLD family